MSPLQEGVHVPLTDIFPSVAAVAIGQAVSLSPIRAIQHLDANGNPIGQCFSGLTTRIIEKSDLSTFIADPDRSNPTRSRWERPLDTIRSFEAAIDGNYSRKSYMRTGEITLPHFRNGRFWIG